MTVRSVIQGVYGLQPYQLVSEKNPVLNQKIDIEAKTERPVSSSTQVQQMLQPLLAERFKLAIHRETREMNAPRPHAHEGRTAGAEDKKERPGM
jgi:uncharacterized protein (TIGR03435 family)